MSDRTGLFTEEQEALLDELIKFGNPVLESLDGPAISLVDNQVIDRLMNKLEEKYPEAKDLMTEIIDIVFLALGQLPKE